MADSPPPNFTPERAERYAAGTLPGLFARIESHLVVADASESQRAAPSPEVARLAILSVREILSELGPWLSEDTVVPARAALARFEKLYLAHHADRPLVMPGQPPSHSHGPTRSLAEIVEAAWRAPGPAADAKPNPSPGLDLPPNGVHSNN